MKKKKSKIKLDQIKVIKSTKVNKKEIKGGKQNGGMTWVG